MYTTKLALLGLVGLAASCASPPRFYDSRLIGSEFDENSAATRVTVTFEVWDSDGLPINDVEKEQLSVLEDGVRATSESSVDLQRTRHPIDVIMLLDRSESVRDSESGPNIRSIAKEIIDGLAGHPCNVQLYSFANTVEPLSSVGELSAIAGGDAKSRWTALYYAINTVLNERGLLSRPESGSTNPDQAPHSPSTVLVVCTDGADNYSHNHDLMTLVDLEKKVRANGVVIHALGLGNVDQDQDRQGINGTDALRRLAVHGSFREVGKPEVVDELVNHISRYVRATYSCIFVSPSITGEHELVLEVNRDGRRGRSKPIRFPTHGPASR